MDINLITILKHTPSASKSHAAPVTDEQWLKEFFLAQAINCSSRN